MNKSKRVINTEVSETLCKVVHSLNGDNSQGVISGDTHAEFQTARHMSVLHNPWFTENSLTHAMTGIAHMLRPEAIQTWINQSKIERTDSPKRVGLILAGNIPLVGFHDVFTTGITGNKAVSKLSSQDRFLLPTLFKAFNEAVGENFFDTVWVDGRLPEIDAVIATGSNNTARYFEYYFGKYPHVIRKNRSSVAVVTGDETDKELAALGEDIFSYFGLGCRNVSKVYFHKNFDLDRFFKAIYSHREIVNHHKYANNYDYYKALWMMNREDLLENGFLILRPSEAISSPPATLFYERFDDERALRETLENKAEEIQCIVSQKDIPFGKSQKPEIWDYADDVDTVAFLKKMNANN